MALKFPLDFSLLVSHLTTLKPFLKLFWSSLASLLCLFFRFNKHPLNTNNMPHTGNNEDKVDEVLPQRGRGGRSPVQSKRQMCLTWCCCSLETHLEPHPVPQVWSRCPARNSMDKWTVTRPDKMKEFLPITSAPVGLEWSGLDQLLLYLLSLLPTQDQPEKATYVPLTNRIGWFQLAWSCCKPTVSNQGIPEALQFFHQKALPYLCLPFSFCKTQVTMLSLPYCKQPLLFSFGWSSSISRDTMWLICTHITPFE